METPLLSVCLITYNHEKFIRQAIEGILMQEVNFKWELIIADDFSTDKTREIILEYKKQYPDFIKLIFQEKNVGPAKNWLDLISAPKSKYIAYLEGDDYWTDSLKLQKQVDFLDKNKDYNICFHRANLLSNKGLTLHEIPTPYQSLPFDYIKLLEHYNFITSASVVFRNPENFVLPKCFQTLPFGDLGLLKIVSDGKKIACINEIMSVYRIHENGVFSGLNQLNTEIKYLDFYKNIYYHLNGEEKKVVLVKIKKTLYKIAGINSKNIIISKIYYSFNLMKFYKYL